MSTDTALLTTKLIIEHNYKLEDIPFINEPQIEGVNQDGNYNCIIMEGFKYITKEIDPTNGNRLEKSEEIIMGKDIKEKYILEDFDINMLM